MKEILQIVGSIILLSVYFFYLRQMMQGKSTPNPGTWLVWFVIMGINAFNYLKVVSDDYLKAAIVFVGFAGITMVMLYALFKGRFARLVRFDIALLILSFLILAFWALGKNAQLSGLLLQIVIFSSFLPTAAGLLQKRLKEAHLPWTLATTAYLLQTISLLINFDGNIYQLFLPVINGIMGNGMIAAIIWYKQIKT